MRLAEAPSSADAVQTLEQIVSDKSKISAAARCEGRWSQHGGIGAIVTDLGGAFVSEEFRSAVLDLGGTIEQPPGGIPRLRGTIERMFKTYGTRLMPLLSGRTFSNPEERGDYPTEQLACHTDDSLMEVLVRYVVDVYHNSGHAGLKGETPANCWNRLADKYGVRSRPCGTTRRAIFGRRMTRRISGKGVLAFGLSYTCDALRQQYLHGHEKTALISADTSNLGWIVIWLNGMWHPARALQSNFDGVSLAEWKHVARQIRTQHAGDSAVHEKTIAAAFKGISQINREAMERLNLSPPTITEAQFEREHDRLFLGLTIVPDRATVIPDGDADLFGNVIDPDRLPDDQRAHTEGRFQSPDQEERLHPPRPPRWRLEDD